MNDEWKDAVVARFTGKNATVPLPASVQKLLNLSLENKTKHDHVVRQRWRQLLMEMAALTMTLIHRCCVEPLPNHPRGDHHLEKQIITGCVSCWTDRMHQTHDDVCGDHFHSQHCVSLFVIFQVCPTAVCCSESDEIVHKQHCECEEFLNDQQLRSVWKCCTGPTASKELNVTSRGHQDVLQLCTVVPLLFFALQGFILDEVVDQPTF